MRRSISLLVAAPVLAAIAVHAHDAHACGGCFIAESENTQVTGHRMILSVSMDQTTLYDQIQYSGAPEDFAWVLPIRGQVEVGLSSDAMFSMLEQMTAVTINSPQINCPQPVFCDSDGFANGAGGGGGASGGGVEIIAEEVVGPYATVQLSASDPDALNTWLSDNGYNIPPAVQPVIDQYVADGMDFLALRLAPGQGVSAMRPVRVTTPGGGPVLPLRMVVAGTGAVTSLSLWVVSDGRYEPQNFPSFIIDPSDLVWDWDSSRSNYGDLKAAGFATTNGFGWLADAAEPLYDGAFWQLTDLASYDPVGSGYADEDGTNAVENAQADLDVLTYGIQTMWVNRLSAELPSDALTTDLVLRAASSQTPIERWLDVTNTVGTEPQCPPTPPPQECDDGGGDDDGWWFDFGPNSKGNSEASGGGCAMGERSSLAGESGLTVLALSAWALARRRRRSA